MDSETKKTPLKIYEPVRERHPVFKLILIGTLLLAVLGLLVITAITDVEKEKYIHLKGSKFNIRGRNFMEGELYEGIVYGNNTYFGRPTILPLQGDINATNAGDACSSTPYEKSRVCLYLNVYRCSAEKRHQKEQVIVYVGGERIRNSGIADLVPDVAIGKYACKGSIVVSVNYRRGAFGYFTTGEEHTGNNGVYDVKVALEWIQENIKYFGGNAENVTVLAAGNGARVVSLLARLPESKGLLHQLILTGGSSFTPFSIRDVKYGVRSSRWFSSKIGCSNDTTWNPDARAANPAEVRACFDTRSLPDLVALDEKSGSHDFTQWPFVLDEELVRSELVSSKKSVGQSIPTLFLVCLDKELHDGDLYKAEQVRKILRPIYELKLPEFKDFLQYYVEQLTNETSNNAMPKKWDHYKMMQRVYSNFVYLGSLLLETQATSRRDVLTYFMFITNRQKEDPYTAATPLCLGEDLFDPIKPLQQEYYPWKDKYGDAAAEFIMNFVIKADPTLQSSPYIWPWYDPENPEVVIFDSKTLTSKVRPVGEVESSNFWICEVGKKYLQPEILPRFCKARKN